MAAVSASHNRAADPVRVGVDVIATWFTPTATAANQPTRDIPMMARRAG
jgi:hypothetical protein